MRAEVTLACDLVVVGGGPAGAAAAIALARAGRRVVVVERLAGPTQKVCGEFLGGDAVERLDRFGLAPQSLGALPIGRIRLTAGRRSAVADLPFPAWSLGRDLLDEALLTRATAEGAVVLRGRSVDRLVIAGAEAQAWLGDRRIVAGAALLATGKHDLRGWRRGLAAETPLLIGFKQYWRLDRQQAQALDGTIELHFFPGGYAGLLPSAAGAVNLCWVVGAEWFEAEGRDPSAVLASAVRQAPLLGERLAGAIACWPRPLAVAGLPSAYLHRVEGPAGPHRIGDQAAVIPSFCGDGIAIALATAGWAATRAGAGLPPATALPLARPIGRARAVIAALRGPRMAGLAVTLAARWPGVMAWLARTTRVPADDCRRAAEAGRPADPRNPDLR